MSTTPLAGIRVLDLSRMFPGAYCTQLLADLGADVLKVESPGFGDGMRTMAASHETLNRGKRSLALDLRTAAAGDVVRRLVRDVDVLVEGHRPGALDAQGIGYDDLRQVNPGLVWCSLTGFGPDGPLAQAPGHDLTYLGFSGLLGALAVDGEPPVPGTTISLALAGVLGAFGILAGLNERSRTGVGIRVDASMVDAARWVIGDLVAQAAAGPVQAWPALASRANYRCADGRWITCTASEPKTWAVLVDALDAPDLAGYRIGVDDEVARTRLAEIFASAPAAQWVERPGPAGGIGAVAEPEDLTAEVPVRPLRLDGRRPDVARPAPALGAHTDEALAAAGLTDEEIGALRAEGVIT